MLVVGKTLHTFGELSIRSEVFLVSIKGDTDGRNTEQGKAQCSPAQEEKELRVFSKAVAHSENFILRKGISER